MLKSPWIPSFLSLSNSFCRGIRSKAFLKSSTCMKREDFVFSVSFCLAYNLPQPPPTPPPKKKQNSRMGKWRVLAFARLHPWFVGGREGWVFAVLFYYVQDCRSATYAKQGVTTADWYELHTTALRILRKNVQWPQPGWCLNHAVQKDSRGVLGTSFRFGPLIGLGNSRKHPIWRLKRGENWQLKKPFYRQRSVIYGIVDEVCVYCEFWSVLGPV